MILRRTPEKYACRLLAIIILLLTAGTFDAAADNIKPGRPNWSNIVTCAKASLVAVLAVDGQGREKSRGSGVIVRKDGLILTAWHAVCQARKVKVELADGATCWADGLLGWDGGKDFALLKIPASDLPVLPLGDSDKLQAGDPVLALRAPWHDEPTAAEGAISLIDDSLWGVRLMQITNPLTFGYSGGPVLNTKGEIIGLVSFVMLIGAERNFALPSKAFAHTLEFASIITPLKEAVARERDGSAASLYLAGMFDMPRNPDNLKEQAKLKRALESFRKAAHKQPDFAAAYSHIGICLVALGRGKEAVEAYKTALRLKPDYAEAAANLGAAYGRMGRYKEAAAAYEKALQWMPDSAAAHYNLGVIYLALKERGKARKEYETLKGMNKESAEKLERALKRK